MRILMWQRLDDRRILGGHIIQLEKVAGVLREDGHDVQISRTEEIATGEFDVVHGHGLTSSDIARCHRRGMPVALTTTFPSGSWRVGRGRVRDLVDQARASASAARAAWRDELYVAARRASPRLAKASAAFAAADLLLPNARGEAAAIADELGVDTDARLVPNAADPSFFRAGARRERRGSLACVGRIEPHKNQLALIEVARRLSMPLLVVGAAHPHHRDYYEQCLVAGRRSGAEFIPHLDQEGLADLLERVDVHVLPSWFETTGLASLEAALAGTKVVSTARGWAGEYLGDHAWYCDPASPRTLLAATRAALSASWSDGLQRMVLERFTWRHAADATMAAYEELVSG